MMRKKFSRWSIDQFTETEQEIITKFINQFSDSNVKIPFRVPDSGILFIQKRDRIDPYRIVPFVQSIPDISVELEALSNGYWVMRFYYSDWQRKNQVPKNHRIMSQKVDERPLHQDFSIMVQDE